MRTIVKASLRFRWIVLFLAASMLALGFVQIPETKVDVFPEFAPPQVEIQTIALGNSSERGRAVDHGPHRGPVERALKASPNCGPSRSPSCPRSG